MQNICVLQRFLAPVTQEVSALAFIFGSAAMTAEALENLKNAVDLLVEYLLEVGEAIPEEPCSQIQVSDVPLITVTV